MIQFSIITIVLGLVLVGLSTRGREMETILFLLGAFLAIFGLTLVFLRVFNA